MIPTTTRSSEHYHMELGNHQVALTVPAVVAAAAATASDPEAVLSPPTVELSPQTSGVPILQHSSSADHDALHPDGHKHYSQRSPWLRALVLGANDGLVSIASLMVGVSAVKYDVKASLLAGVAGLIAGACSMGIGEYVSVYSQRDTELADLEKEKQEHMAGPEAAARELEELAQIYVSRGLSYYLAKQVAEELSNNGVDDALKAHARDELGIDLDGLSNPMQAATASALAFLAGGFVPLLAGGFVDKYIYRIAALVISSTVALGFFGAVGAKLGGAPLFRAALRVTIGGLSAMLVTYGVLYLISLVV